MKAPVTPLRTPSDALILTWNPALTTGSSPPSYQLQFRVTGATTWLSCGAPIAGLSGVIEGLSASTSYDYQVIDLNNIRSAISIPCSGSRISLAPAAAAVTLPICEIFVALIAPKGRAAEALLCHDEELQNLVRDFGPVKGVWRYRLQLANAIMHMLPTIVMRLAVLWRVISG